MEAFMEKFIKKRESFVVRWLKTFDSNKNEFSIIDIEHVQSGETWRVSSIEDATLTMKNVSTAETISAEEPVNNFV